MSRRLGSITISLDDESGVERPGPGLAPTAFRIWRAGENVVKWSGGPPETFLFTARSAELLKTQQEQRGLLYMFDIDHRSLTPRTTEDGEAAGWHRLEFRLDADGNPECWAAACEWTPEIRAGLESKPPKWRYFSPVWGLDPETNEITEYTNCAVTNNPATQQIPSLAASLRGRRTTNQGMTMNKEAALAALAALAEESLTDKQKEAVAALAAFVDSSEDEKKPEDKEANDSESEKDEDKKEANESEKDEDKKEAKAATNKPLDLSAEIERLRIEAVLDRAGITGERRASLMGEPLDFVKKFVSLSSPFTASRQKRPTQVERDGAVDSNDPIMEIVNKAGSGVKKDKVK